MSDAPDALHAPSQHPVPTDIPQAAGWRLIIDGQVRRPLALSLADLRELPRWEHQGNFTCERGWEGGAQRWQGAALAAALDLAEPLPEATALVAHAGAFRSLVPLSAVPHALLADHLDGHPLTVERGAPCRLVVTDPVSELSMKWLERIEVCAAGPEPAPGPRKPG